MSLAKQKQNKKQKKQKKKKKKRGKNEIQTPAQHFMNTSFRLTHTRVFA